MRVLLAIVVLAALGWSGFWYWNASTRDRALTSWLEERRAAGWIAEGEPYDTIRVRSERMVGSVVVEPSRLVGLDHSTMEMKGVTLAGTGWTAGIGDALLSTRKTPNPAEPFSYDLDFSANDLRLPDSWIAGIEDTGVLPPAIETTHLAVTATFDRAWDRASIEGENPALRTLQVTDSRFAWGKLDLRAAGTLRPDARGFAEGKLDLTAQNWRDMLDAAERSGMLNPALAGALRGALGLFARLSGDGDTLRLPLEFADGEARLGPVVVGAAPRLTGRG